MYHFAVTNISSKNSNRMACSTLEGRFLIVTCYRELSPGVDYALVFLFPCRFINELLEFSAVYDMNFL